MTNEPNFHDRWFFKTRNESSLTNVKHKDIFWNICYIGWVLLELSSTHYSLFEYLQIIIENVTIYLAIGYLAIGSIGISQILL